MSDGVTGLGGVFFMVNFRVASLDAVLETLEREGIGRFGWAVDPEGNRFELWEPAEGM